MTGRDAVVAALHRVAPDVAPERLTDSADLQADLELDSMDVLGVMTAIEVATGVVVPPSRYPELMTVAALAGYVDAARLPS